MARVFDKNFRSPKRGKKIENLKNAGGFKKLWEITRVLVITGKNAYSHCFFFELIYIYSIVIPKYYDIFR